MVEEHVQVERVERPAARPSDELRQILDRLDNLVSILKRREADEILEIPALFERADALLGRLKSRSKEFQAEEARLRALLGQFDKRDRAFVRKLGMARVAALRPEPALPEDHWWWYMDEVVAARNRARLRRTLISVAIAAVVLIAAVFIYQQFFAPDPTVVAAYGYRGRAEDLAFSGEYQDALTQVDEGLTLIPEDPEMLVLRGAIQAALGESDAAQTTYAEVQAILDKQERPEDFLFLRAQTYIRIDETQLAIDDMQAALEANPESPEAYYLLAAAQDSSNQVQEAYNNYSMAAQYASLNGNVQLEALARMQLANLTNRLMMPSSPPNTTTP